MKLILRHVVWILNWIPNQLKFKIILIAISGLLLYSCNKEIEPAAIESDEFITESSATLEVNASSQFVVTDLQPISIKRTEVRIQFTASAKAQAIIEYGTDVQYGQSTTLEESFMYETHRQFIRNLEPGTQYFYKVIVTNEAGEVATASSSFITVGNNSEGAGTAFTVGQLEPILLEETQARIQFTCDQ